VAVLLRVVAEFVADLDVMLPDIAGGDGREGNHLVGLPDQRARADLEPVVGLGSGLVAVTDNPPNSPAGRASGTVCLVICEGVAGVNSIRSSQTVTPLTTGNASNCTSERRPPSITS